MSRSHGAHVSFALVALLLAIVPATARADAAAARALFDDARKLAASGPTRRVSQVRRKLQARSGMGTLFNVADCLEHLGKTASAWVRFREVVDAASRASQPDREKIARVRAAALDPSCLVSSFR